MSRDHPLADRNGSSAPQQNGSSYGSSSGGGYGGGGSDSYGSSSYGSSQQESSYSAPARDSGRRQSQDYGAPSRDNGSSYDSYSAPAREEPRREEPTRRRSSAPAGRRVSSTKNKAHKGRWRGMDAGVDMSDDQVRRRGAAGPRGASPTCRSTKCLGAPDPAVLALSAPTSHRAPHASAATLPASQLLRGAASGLATARQQRCAPTHVSH